MRADRRLGEGCIDGECLGDDLGEVERLAAVEAFEATEGLEDGVSTGPSHTNNAATTPDQRWCAVGLESRHPGCTPVRASGRCCAKLGYRSPRDDIIDAVVAGSSPHGVMLLRVTLAYRRAGDAPAAAPQLRVSSPPLCEVHGRPR